VAGDGDAGRELILVADDDEDILNLVCFRLEQAGWEVARAADGAEAAAIANERRPALCVFDVQMPEMTGYQVVEKMRADDGLKETPVILLTASVQERDMAKGFEVGADDYMRKPFDPNELLSRIEALLRRR